MATTSDTGTDALFFTSKGLGPDGLSNLRTRPVAELRDGDELIMPRTIGLLFEVDAPALYVESGGIQLTEAAARKLVGELQAWLDTPPDAPPVVVESADGAVAATPIDDAPRFRVALLRDVPDGARVAPFPSDNDDHETAADSLNVGRALPRDFYWDTAAVCRDGHGPTTPCIVDSRPEATGSTTDPYCACGRRVSECDQSRAGCAKARC